jgi:tRNA-specific 2-thiouridylase
MKMKANNNKVIVAMSGGVDSSVAAALLKERGYEVIGVTILMRYPCVGGSGTTPPDSCCFEKSLADAKKVCEQLGIPHHYINLEEEFGRLVVDRFVNEYTQGRTPNPCVVCNRDIKFTGLLDNARKLKARYVATGHYARVTYDAERKRYVLKRGIDPSKDQSYVLCGLNQSHLEVALFPLGEMTKAETRHLAERFNLSVSDKQESQEICFIDDDYRDFLRKVKRQERKREMPGMTPGPIMDMSGKVIGTHKGFAGYTIGQRRGLGISSTRPLYVVAIDPSKNAVIVGQGGDLLSKGLVATEVNMVSVEKFESPQHVGVKVRYRSPEMRALLTPTGAADTVHVLFDTPQRAVTPGQTACFYWGDEVLAGGVIDKPLKD